MGLNSPDANTAVSFAFGTVDLIANYSDGNITKAEFSTGCKVLCIQSVMCAVGAAIGDKLIPVPVLGSIIGAAILGNISEEMLGNGAYGAIRDTSSYVYGNSLVVVETTRTLAANHCLVQQNMKTGATVLSSANEKIDAVLAALGGNE